MDKHQSVALEASIKHWKELTTVQHHSDVHIGHRDCALCKHCGYGVDPDPWDFDCDACPVGQATGKGECVGTPHRRAYDAWADWRYDADNADMKHEFHVAARQMRIFLENLKEEKDDG